MGHTKLGTIPKSKKWSVVVREIAGEGRAAETTLISEDVQHIASKTLEAAQQGLERAIDDIGLRYTFFLLTQVALAARQDDWYENLERIGIQISETESLFDLTAELQGAIDDYLFEQGGQSDVSEMAQKAAGEAVFSLAAPSAFTLFGNSGDDLRIAIKALSTKSGFAQLSQSFFGRFMARFLNFYLSRITAAEINSVRVSDAGHVTEFNRALENHCEQSAAIIRDFSGQWYSKTEYLEGIDFENTSRFMAVALRKLKEELRHQGMEQ